MSKADKIAEGRFFLLLMQHAEERDPFRYCLSAFLSAVRSVLQYAHKDAARNPAAHALYESVMAASLVLSFFKDKRNFNIHEAPVPVQMHVAVGLSDNIAI